MCHLSYVGRRGRRREETRQERGGLSPVYGVGGGTYIDAGVCIRTNGAVYGNRPACRIGLSHWIQKHSDIRKPRKSKEPPIHCGISIFRQTSCPTGLVVSLGAGEEAGMCKTDSVVTNTTNTLYLASHIQSRYIVTFGGLDRNILRDRVGHKYSSSAQIPLLAVDDEGIIQFLLF